MGRVDDPAIETTRRRDAERGSFPQDNPDQ